IANPMKKLKYDDKLDQDLLGYYLITNHAAQLICATKWIASFSRDEIPAQLKYIFINPMLTYIATLLKYRSGDPILNWGVTIIRGLCSKSIEFSKEFLAIDSTDFGIPNKNHFDKDLFLRMANGNLKLSKKLG
ncbi:unnamed protein product, partial [marine sediment metagenome]